FFFFFQAEDGIRDFHVTGVQTCALPICVIEMLDPFSGDGNAHGFSEPVVADDSVTGFTSDTVVSDGTAKNTILYGNSDVDRSSGTAWKQPMDDGVFDEGLDEKGRYHDVGRVASRCQGDVHQQTIAETEPLQSHVLLHGIQLIDERDNPLLRAFQYVARKAGKVAYVMGCKGFVMLIDDGIDAVKAVVEEMGVHLGAPGNVLQFAHLLLVSQPDTSCFFSEIPQTTKQRNQGGTSGGDKIGNHVRLIGDVK